MGADQADKAEAALTMINAIANPTNPEKGEQYLGTVVKITAFGAFVALLPGKDGLLHISETAPLAGGQGSRMSRTCSASDRRFGWRSMRLTIAASCR